MRKSCIACKAAGREYVQPFGLVFDENGKFLPKNAPEHDHDLEQLIGGGDSPIAAGELRFALKANTSNTIFSAISQIACVWLWRVSARALCIVTC